MRFCQVQAHSACAPRQMLCTGATPHCSRPDNLHTRWPFPAGASDPPEPSGGGGWGTGRMVLLRAPGSRLPTGEWPAAESRFHGHETEVGRTERDGVRAGGQ